MLRLRKYAVSVCIAIIQLTGKKNAPVQISNLNIENIHLECDEKSGDASFTEA